MSAQKDPYIWCHWCDLGVHEKKNSAAEKYYYKIIYGRAVEPRYFCSVACAHKALPTYQKKVFVEFFKHNTRPADWKPVYYNRVELYI